MRFTLVPLKSVGDIRLGMSRAEVRAVVFSGKVIPKTLTMRFTLYASPVIVPGVTVIIARLHPLKNCRNKTINFVFL